MNKKNRKIFFALRMAILFSLISLSTRVYAVPAVKLDIQVFEGEKENKESFGLIDQREVLLYDLLETSSFQANFTISIKPTVLDSSTIRLKISLFTLPPEFQMLLKEEIIKNRDTLTIDNIKFKKGRVLKALLIPEIREEKEPDCNLVTTDTLTWYYDASVHYQYHYLKFSLADYHWSTNKGYLENEYKWLKKAFDFAHPTKVEYYLSPCELKEISWDNRFHTAIDPTKSKAYVLYNNDIKGVDTPAGASVFFYRFWGYAPMFLVEGASGYVGWGYYFSQKFKKEKKLFPLSELLTNYQYRNKNPDIAWAQSSSFCRFLIDTYGVGRFKELYELATDLTLEKALKEVYLETLPELEKEWLKSLDTYVESDGNLNFFGNFMLFYGRNDKAEMILNDLMGSSLGKQKILEGLGNVNYISGNYQKAIEIFNELVKQDTTKAINYFYLGNMYYVTGKFDSAQNEYYKAIALDSNFTSPYVRLANFQLFQKNYDSAQALYETALKKKPILENLIEIYLGLGDILRQKGKKPEADLKYIDALGYAKRMLNDLPEYPASHFRMGQAFLKLGEADSAISYLKVANFLENTPFLKGKAILALGEASELLGNKSIAKEIYAEILKIPAGTEEKRKAQENIERLNSSP
jgi:tetratricopeptide (TPR) repeat protein